MMEYKLLTPGPLTTTAKVKQAMLYDYSTWDDDFKEVTQSIRQDLLALAHVTAPDYTSVLMQGSGTFGVESALTSLVGQDDKVLICANGAYGLRMVEICQAQNINHSVYQIADDQALNANDLQSFLAADDQISHVALVHSETTTGLVNDIESIGRVVKAAGKVLMVDAMSSFGGIDINVGKWGIDVLVSSANKCIQGVPGFAFIIVKRELIKASKGKAKSLSLDLYDQWETMDIDGKWRFTSPTHTVMAFRQALDELEAEGGIPLRAARYQANNDLLNQEMKKLGFDSYIDPAIQGPFISTYLIPDEMNLDFNDLYDYVKDQGYVIYPGKLTDRNSFRIGNIGEIYPQDIKNVTNIIGDYLNMKNKNKPKLAIFDWAGTTIDFGCMAPVEAFRQAFAAKDINVTDAEIRQPMGMTKIDHVRQMLEMNRIKAEFKALHNRDYTEEDVQEIYAVFEKALFDSVANFTEPKPYVLETIEALKAQGVMIGSTTGYTAEMMTLVEAKAAQVGYTADFMVTSDDTNGKGRPYPYMIFRNVEHFNIPNLDQVIKIGDTIADIKEGQHANVKTVGVVDGSSEMGLSLEAFETLTEREKDDHRQRVIRSYEAAGADYIIRDFRDLLELFS